MKHRLLHAVNFELPATTNEPPAELMLIPPGTVVTGRDGRKWNNPRPQGVVDYFKARNVDIVFDIEHATELKAPKGDAAPGVAWGKDVYAKPDGSVWARVDWNENGRGLVMNREYRYYSPVFVYHKATNDIVGISSVGLTNKPNLEVNALNSEQHEEEVDMLTAEQMKQLCTMLGLAENASGADILAACRKCCDKAMNSETPSLDRFVPRADYDATLARATNAEQKLKEKDAAELETAINSEIDAALQAGKIVPATKDYYVAMCRQDGGLDEFKKFVAAAPVIGGKSNLDEQDPNADNGKALNAAQKEVCTKLGITEEEFAKAL